MKTIKSNSFWLKVYQWGSSAIHSPKPVPRNVCSYFLGIIGSIFAATAYAVMIGGFAVAILYFMKRAGEDVARNFNLSVSGVAPHFLLGLGSSLLVLLAFVSVVATGYYLYLGFSKLQNKYCTKIEVRD